MAEILPPGTATRLSPSAVWPVCPVGVFVSSSVLREAGEPQPAALWVRTHTLQPTRVWCSWEAAKEQEEDEEQAA